MDASRKRLLLYLLLNVVISICATSTVLFVYDRYFRSPGVPSPLAGSAASVENGQASLEVVTVIGAGLPSNETVVIRNTGQAEASLKDWKIQDEQSNIYTFSNLTLPPGGAVQLHTAPGSDSLIDLYWGLTASAWATGETVSLLDPAGTVKSVYKVP